MTVALDLTGGLREKLWAHLLKNKTEQVAFLFAAAETAGDATVFRPREVYLAGPGDFDMQTGYHIALTDEARARIIKRAWDSGTSLVELHSHPRDRERTMFSPSDLAGFEEFVPHCWWRLRGRPYLAVVVAQKSVDALAWVADPRTPVAVDALRLDGGQEIVPTHLTITALQTQGEENGPRAF
jgi:hypothetical protein